MYYKGRPYGLWECKKICKLKVGLSIIKSQKYLGSIICVSEDEKIKIN